MMGTDPDWWSQLQPQARWIAMPWNYETGQEEAAPYDGSAGGPFSCMPPKIFSRGCREILSWEQAESALAQQPLLVSGLCSGRSYTYLGAGRNGSNRLGQGIAA